MLFYFKSVVLLDACRGGVVLLDACLALLAVFLQQRFQGVAITALRENMMVEVDDPALEAGATTSRRLVPQPSVQ